MQRIPQTVIKGRWLLLMRLNGDHLTGRDFVLLPPDLHESFTGFMGPRRGASLSVYTVRSADELVERLRYIGKYGDPNFDEVRWSG